MHIESWVLLLALPLAALVAGSGAAASLEAAVDAFFDRHFEFYPTFASSAGLHEYDGRIGARDASAVEVYLRDLRTLESRFDSIEPGELSEDERLDRALILREIRGELFWHEEVGLWRTNPIFYAAEMDMTLLLLLDYAPLVDRMAAVVDRLEAFPELLEAARRNVARAPRPFVETARVVFQGWPSFLEEELTAALAGVEAPRLQARFAEARDRAVTAVRTYARHLESLLASTREDFALGEARFRRMNRLLADVDLPMERLSGIAEDEIERLQALGAELVDRTVPGRGIGEALDSIGVDRLPANGIVAEAASQIDRLRRFVDGCGLGTVLPGQIETRESPPFSRTNFAYIWIPGPFETKAKTGFYFIQPVEPEWSQEVRDQFLARNNRWAILNTTVHEAYPGHYHHFAHLHHAPTRVQRLLPAYVTLEGWAHYSEEMIWRAGLQDGDPRLGLAMIQDALLRAVRLRVAIGLHTEGLAVAEAERMFRDLAFQDPVNARQQALRGTYDPEYLNYTLGKLMLQRLREDMEAKEGSAFDVGRFHDAFMARGAPPIPWIARRMLEEPNWRPFT